MEKPKKKPRKPLLQLIMLGIIVGIIGILLFSATRVYFSVERPTNLGSKLEYVGKVDNNCFPSCGDPLGATYFFATDMTVKELRGYFKGAKADSTEMRGYDSGIESYFTTISYHIDPDRPFYINYYPDSKERLMTVYHLASTRYLHVVSMNSLGFSNAKQALR